MTHCSGSFRFLALSVPSLVHLGFSDVGDDARLQRYRRLPHSIPNSFHFLSTIARVFSSIRISSGQGRANPSVGHFRVASIPIFEPKLGSREAWSSESTGPSVN